MSDIWSNTSSGLHVKYTLYLSDFNEIWLFIYFLKKCSNIKFYENPSSGRRVVLCGQKDRHMDMTNLILSFRNIANALINFTPCRLVKYQTFRSTAMPWRRRYAFTSTHGVTFHSTYHHQHRSETFKFGFYIAVYMTWRNTCCDRFNALFELRHLLQCDAACTSWRLNVLPYRHVATVWLALPPRYHVTHSWMTTTGWFFRY
jgi:hypothetical protein